MTALQAATVCVCRGQGVNAWHTEVDAVHVFVNIQVGVMQQGVHTHAHIAPTYHGVLVHSKAAMQR